MDNEIFTAEQVRAEITEEVRKEMLKALEEDTEVPDFLKETERFQHVWLAGCWLNNKLAEAGCEDELRQKIGFAHGQRSAFGNPYKWAGYYWSLYQKGAHEEPGPELADRINNAHIRQEGNRVTIRVEKP